MVFPWLFLPGCVRVLFGAESQKTFVSLRQALKYMTKAGGEGDERVVSLTSRIALVEQFANVRRASFFLFSTRHGAKNKKRKKRAQPFFRGVTGLRQIKS